MQNGKTTKMTPKKKTLPPLDPQKLIDLEIAKAEVALREAERLAHEAGINSTTAFDGIDRDFVKSLLGLFDSTDPGGFDSTNPGGWYSSKDC